LPKANYILQTNAKEEKSEAKVENKKDKNKRILNNPELHLIEWRLRKSGQNRKC